MLAPLPGLCSDPTRSVHEELNMRPRLASVCPHPERVAAAQKTVFFSAEQWRPKTSLHSIAPALGIKGTMNFTFGV